MDWLCINTSPMHVSHTYLAQNNSLARRQPSPTARKLDIGTKMGTESTDYIFNANSGQYGIKIIIIQLNSLCAESTATRPLTHTAQYRYT
jgi:hypothetical protein